MDEGVLPTVSEIVGVENRQAEPLACLKVCATSQRNGPSRKDRSSHPIASWIATCKSQNMYKLWHLYPAPDERIDMTEVIEKLICRERRRIRPGLALIGEPGDAH